MANAHSLFRYADLRFYGIDGHLYRNNVQILNNVFDGTRLVFVKMPPTTNVDVSATQIADHLFIAGGGTLKKVNGAGQVTNWGIEPPPDGFTAAGAAPLSKTIDLLDNAGSWSGSDATL